MSNPKRTLMVESFDGKPFNSLNEVRLSPDNQHLYFSDPNYGANQGFKPEPILPNSVYRYSLASQELAQLTTEIAMPNGLAVSKDGNTLFVSDSSAEQGIEDTYNKDGGKDIYSFDLRAQKPSKTKTHFARVDHDSGKGIPDGMIVYGEMLFSAAANGVNVYSTDTRQLIAVIETKIGGAVSLIIGDIKDAGSQIFVLTDKSIEAMDLDTLIYALQARDFSLKHDEL